MGSKQRKHYSPEQKVALLRRHLIDRIPVSELCDESGLRPTVFYRWQQKFFENGTAAFLPIQDDRHRDAKTIKALKDKLHTKNEVLAEVMEQHVALRKELGEL